MKAIDVVAAGLVVVGALNWGLVAIARFDLVAALFGLSFGQVSAVTASSTDSRRCRSVSGLLWKRVQPCCSRQAHA